MSAILKIMVVRCSKCKEDTKINMEDDMRWPSCEWHVISGECEMCGSHSTVSFRFECPNCKRDNKVIVYED